MKYAILNRRPLIDKLNILFSLVLVHIISRRALWEMKSFRRREYTWDEILLNKPGRFISRYTYNNVPS